MSDQPAENQPVDPKVAEARANYTTMMAWLEQMDADLRQLSAPAAEGPGREARLFCRVSNAFFWEQCGFYVGPDPRDNGKIKLFVKIGGAIRRDAEGKDAAKHYQPIGEVVNGNELYLSQMSRMLWFYDFAISSLTPYAPPWRPEPVADTEADQQNAAYLSDAQRDRMVQAMKDLHEEVDATNAAMAAIDAAKDEATLAELDKVRVERIERLVDTIKLISLQVPSVERCLEDLAKKNPKFKKDLSGIDPRGLAESVSEFIRMKLNDDGARRMHKMNLVSNLPNAELTIIDGLIAKFERLVPAEEANQAQFDDKALAAAIEGAEVAYPALAATIMPFRDTTDLVACGRACMAMLRLEKARLTAT